VRPCSQPDTDHTGRGRGSTYNGLHMCVVTPG
jgi:hypothetical protein